MGAFDHLVPGDDKPKESEAPGAFDHLVPKTTAGGILRTLAASGVDNVGALMQGGGEIGAKVLNSITGTQDFTATNPLKFATDYIKGGMTEGDKLAAQDSFKGDVLKPSTWEAPGTVGGVGHAVAQGLGSVLPTLATAYAARGRAVPAMAAQGGLMTGGAAAGDIRDNFDKLDDEKLMAASPAYAQLVQSGMNPADARAKVVNESAQTSGLMAGALGAAGGAFNAKLLEDFIARKGIPALLGKTLAERGVARTATGAATGAVGEGLQEGLEKVGQNAGENIGMGKSIGDDVTRDTFGDVVGGAMVGKITGGVGGALAKPATVVAPDGGVIDPNAGPISRAAATAINTGAAQQKADQKTAEAAAQEQQQQQSEAKQQQNEAAKAFTGKAQFDDPVKWWEALNGAGQTALIQKLDGDERQTALDLMATARDPRTSGAIREKAAGMLYGIAQNIGLPGTVAPVSPLALPSPKKDGDQIASDNIEKWSAKFPALTLPQVQHMQRLASEQGHDDFAIVPHSSGEGYTLVPQSWVGQSAVTKESTALQGEGNGLLPSPNTPRSGTFVAGKDGVRQQTYGDLDTTAQRAVSEASETLGDRKPQPAQVIRNADPTSDVSTKVKPGAVEGEYIRGRQAAEQYFPFKNPQQAEARAMAATKEFGEEYGVEPHPSVKGAFAVVPASKALTQKSAVENGRPLDDRQVSSSIVKSNGRQESEQLFSESGIAQGVEQVKQTSRFAAKTVPNVQPAGDGTQKLLTAQNGGEKNSALTGAISKPAYVDEAAHASATSPQNDLPQPTAAQIEANNYKLGHVKVAGLDISIENPSGSTRSGTNADGKAWQTTMRDHYGYVKRSTGADKDQVDVFIKGGTAPDHGGDVYVVDQVDPKTGRFDEHKALLGYRNMMQAAAAYRAHYEKGWKGMGAITPMPMEEFKKWVKSPEAAKPLALEDKRAKSAQDYVGRQWVDADGQKRKVLSHQGGNTATVATVGREGTVSMTPDEIEASIAGKKADAVATPPVAEVPKVSKKELAKVQREAEVSTFNDLSASPAMIGKTIPEIGAEVRARVPAAAPDKVLKLATAIHKAVEGNAKEIEKAKHRDPAVLQAAIAASVGQADSANFGIGFMHALAGKTKSTLSGEHLADMLTGYAEAKKWIQTPEGEGYYEGKPVSKLKNTGIDLRRFWEQMRDTMKDGETDVQKGWAQIEKATNRASMFEPLLPDNITPGMRLYVEKARSLVMPFKKWLEERNRFYGRLAYNRGKYAPKVKQSNIDLLLAGTRYPGELDEESRKKFETDEGYRMRWLQDKANEYLKAANGFVSFLEGKGSVADAAKEFSERYVTLRKGRDGQNPFDWELNKAGDTLRTELMDGNDMMSLRDGSTFVELLTEKEATIALPTRATPLTPPKLDRVTRDQLPDRRNSRDVTPDEFKVKFGFADVGFGKWVANKQDQDHLNYAFDAFSDLAEHFGIAPKNIGFGGNLHFTVGALGAGKASAHFWSAQPHPDGGNVSVINLTNTKGDGTVYHEWVHALDHFAGGEWTNRVRPYLLSLLKRELLTPALVEKRAADFLIGSWGFKGARNMAKVDAALKGLDYVDRVRAETTYKQNADALGKDYWGNDHELIARAAEAWAVDTMNGTNTYLVNPGWAGDGAATAAKGYRGTPYPMGDERKTFATLYNALAQSMTWDNGRPSVTIADFKKALPAEFEDGQKRLAELRERPAMEAFYEKLLAQEAEKREAKSEAARQKQREEEARIQELADAKLKELAALDPPKPDTATGPLADDDLSAIFDQAAAELREETQEKPGAPIPGEQEYIAAGTGNKAEQAPNNQRNDDYDESELNEPAGRDGWNSLVYVYGDDSVGYPVDVRDIVTIFDGSQRAVRQIRIYNPNRGSYMAVWEWRTSKLTGSVLSDLSIDQAVFHYSLSDDTEDAFGRNASDGDALWSTYGEEITRALAKESKQESAKPDTLSLPAPTDAPATNPIADEKIKLRNTLAEIARIEKTGKSTGALPKARIAALKKLAESHERTIRQLRQDAFKDDDVTPTPATPATTPSVDPSAAKLIAEAAKQGVTGINEALTGLSKLFGGGQKGRLNSFPSGFDQDTYKQAKPHFKAALDAFQQAGKSLKDLFKMLIQQFGDGVKPYAIQFAKDEGLTSQLGAKPSATIQVADWVQTQIAKGEEFTSRQLFEQADAAFAGTQAEGKYTVKDAYDAMEAGVNRYIMSHPGEFNPNASPDAAAIIVDRLSRMTKMLATQTKRTEETDAYQQFSTVPPFAYLANWVANVRSADTMIEPSAGIGGLAVFAKNAGATLVLNELSSRRAAVLQEVFPSAQVFHENAEQLNNILPESIRPTVAVMNPPFSSSAERGVNKTTMIGAQHVIQALERLEPGGRLVAIVGEGMTMDKPVFRTWWNIQNKKYDVRAVIPVDGSGYAKYGTTFNNALLVIDKQAPSGRTIVTTPAQSYNELIGLLAEVRNERPETSVTPDRSAERDAAESARKDAVPEGERADNTGTDSVVTSVLGPGQPGAEKLGLAGNGNGISGNSRAKRPGGAVRKPSVADAGAGDNAGAGSDSSVSGDSGSDSTGLTIEQGATAHAELSDSIFESYQPQRLKVPGAKPHPGNLVQSAAMASVLPPPATYTPNLPRPTITEGKLSIAQIEAIVYAGQAHAELLEQKVSPADAKDFVLDPNTQYRRGFFIGDGTGVGKGREISGIMLDNLRQGRKKAVWISEKQGLMNDAKRDFKGVGGDESVIFNQNKTKAEDTIDTGSGIIFTTYSTLRSGAQATAEDKKSTVKVAPKTRLDQLVDWLGKDYDGVIAFDEAHNAGNAIGEKGARGVSKPSAQALAVVELQRRLPNARVVYVSATGATKVMNLSYGTRLGLWGTGTPFPTVSNFVAEMDAGGLATMELVARDMKQMGAYIARSLSFDGVTYSRVEHELSPIQRDIYNRLAQAWQVTLQNFMQALEVTGVIEKSDSGKNVSRNSQALAAAKSAYWGSQQRFFNQVITSMQMPSVADQIERDLADGNAIVLQLVNTNEAAQERALAKKKDDGESTDLEDLDLTPRDQLLQMVQKSFPVVQMESYTDENGNKRSRAVEDSEGNPVLNRAAVALRDKLLKDLVDIKVPNGPLEEILNRFGPEIVAEVTGRGQRIVRKPDVDGNITAQLEKRGANAARADADAFMADKKKILIFSDAGGTGFSFHADLTKPNQRKRKHYLIQPGWRADKAVQGFGRTHRTNQKSAPHYYLASTDIPAQKRFLSSIARRLDQLGALTKGSRDAANQGLFSEKDNLESKYAVQGVQQFFTDLQRNAVEGVNMQDFLRQTGYEDLINPDTRLIPEDKIPGTSQFLNRMLSLELDMQNTVFDAFIKRMEDKVEVAISRGELDTGLETIRALESKVTQEETLYSDAKTGAETKYVELELKLPNKMYPFPSEENQGGKIDWLRNAKSGRVWGRVKSGTETLKNGAVVTRFRMLGTGGVQFKNENDFSKQVGSDARFVDITQDVARDLWSTETAARPQTVTDKAHMITGAILPIWDRLKTPGKLRVARTQTTDGQRLLGRVIEPEAIADIRKRLNIASPASKLAPSEVLKRILQGDTGELANGWKLERARVADDLRIELKIPYGTGIAATADLKSAGLITERISWVDRYFVPVGINGVPVLEVLFKSKPLVDLTTPKANEALGASASGKATAFDKLLHAGIADGRTASDTLKAIQKASRNPFYRELAGALLKSGVDPALELGNPNGLKFSVKNRAAESFAAAFFPKANKVQLFTDANAERNLLHEIMHAATYRAIRKPSLASGQLRALFSHVKKSGQLKGMYGMENMDEFIAEAFSNPKFQAALKGVDAAALRGGKLGSAFDWFVRIVRALLGLKQGQESALSQVIEIGAALIDEQRNMLNANSIRTGVMGAAGDAKPMNNMQVGKAFSDILKALGRDDLGGILMNWNESELNEDGDKITRYPGRDAFVARGVNGGKDNVSKRAFLDWLRSDAPFDQKVYGPNIGADAEWVDQIARARAAAGIVAPMKQQESDVHPQERWAQMLPIAGDTVDGRTVRDRIPNRSSISASITNPHVLDGVRAVPLSAFDYTPGRIDERTLALAEQIRESDEINPLIVAIDDKGPYIIEGGHRLDALIHLGAKELPALVVLDTDALNEPTTSQDGDVMGNSLENANFAKWFGDSKVVDEDGKPLTVYHGSLSVFTAFDKSKLGESTGAASARGGFFFTSNKELAASYGSEGAKRLKKAQNSLELARTQIKELTGDYWAGAAHNYNQGKYDALPNFFKIERAFQRMQAAEAIIDTETDPYTANHDLARNGALYAVHLSLQNPLVHDQEFAEFRDKRFSELIEQAKANGNDGVIIKNTSDPALEGGDYDETADIYVAFEPNQIKSATGNSGAYSLDDDSIMGNIAEDRDMQARIRDKANELLSTKKTFNWWNNTVGTQYAKAEKDADFKRVFDATQDYIGDVSRIANAAADQAPSLLPKTEGLRDVFKKDVSTADRAAIAKPIFQGTLTDSKVYADDELRAQFGLTDKQIGYYREHRAAIDQSLDDLLKTDLLRYVGKAATGLRDAVMQANSPSAAAKIISDRMQQVTGLSDAQVRDYLAAADDAEKVALGFNTAQITAINDIATVRDKADRIDQLKNEGYAPLMRFGRYAVYTTDQNGETIAFTLHETEREATKRAAQMRADNPGATVVQSVMSEEAYKLYAGMEPETLELFAEMSGLEQTPAFQEYLKMTKSNRSAMKRLIKREGIAGFNDDPVRGLAAFITSNARAGSKNLHFGDMLQAAADIPREKGDVLDEAVRLIKYVQDPKQEAQAIRGLLFANYIGGSLASAAVNLTQPLTMTFPYLSQFGTALAAKEMTAAMRTALGKSITNPELAAALKRAESDGIVSPQEIHQLEAEASGRFGKNQYVRKGAYLWGSMFSLAEQYNRRVTFIAAYNMAKTNGELDPFKFAEKAVQETQGIYNKGNRPNWARGALGATIFTFKQFSISYLEFLMRLPQKERAIALGILLLTAGMQGMPGADDADDVIDTIGQGLGYDTNSKAWKTRALTEAIGRDGAEFVMRGGSALPGFPIDVAGRMGMGNLLPGTGVLLKSKADKGSEFAEPLGAAGSFAKDVLSGKVAPLAIRNVAKAVDMYQTGMYRDEKGRKVVDTDGFDAIVKGIGFQPADVARDSRSAQMVQQTVDLAKNVESEITQKWAESIFERDQSKFKAAMEKLIDWNQKNPNTPIAINPSQIKRRIMEMTIDRESRLMKRAPKELRAQMMELYQ